MESFRRSLTGRAAQSPASALMPAADLMSRSRRVMRPDLRDVSSSPARVWPIPARVRSSLAGGVDKLRGFRALRLPALATGALLFVGACDGLSQAMTSHTDVVARAAGRELRVSQAAQMLAINPQIPPDPEVVRALADLWIDYMLLANAVAEDVTLATIDMDDFVEPMREQAIVMRLREAVLHPDTIFDDATLEERWATDGPSAEISARHILLRPPTDATDAQRDSVAQLAEDLRARAVAGESFDDLARAHSQDPGSAVRGGDLGFFGRGRMVPPFDDAAFSLQPGEISPVVETAFGYHVIRVDERRQPELGEDREGFRQLLVQQSIEEAETAFLDSLSAEADVQIDASAQEVVQEIAGRPEQNLRGRQGSRTIATYSGGEYTAADFLTFIRNQPPQVQSAFGTATPEQLESAIQQLVQMRLLVAHAEAQGITMSAEEEAQMVTEARASINSLVEATGFAEAARQGVDPAVLNDYVNQMVQGVVAGEQPFIPLGRLGVSLRELHPHELNEGSFAEVVSQLEEIRAQQPVAPMPQEMEMAPGESIPGQPQAPILPEQAPPVTPAPAPEGAD